MNLNYKIETLLRQTIGLDPNTVGCSMIERAVRLRMRARNLGRQEDYLKLIQHSPAEWDLFVEAVVVTETWFFRDKEVFQTLTRLAMGEWLVANPTRILRVLSAPCSSGEEPYSIAMALMEAGMPASRFQIDAVDISAAALQDAQRGIYGANSFRAQDLEFRTRYFHPLQRGFSLNPSVKKQVRFQRGNLVSDHYLTGPDSYDFIFCRNLLIYLDGANQQKVLVKLRRLMAGTGMLFVGPAEVPLAMSHGFASSNIPGAFACRKLVTPKKISARAHPRKLGQRQLPTPPERPSMPMAIARGLPTNLMSRAEQTANSLADLEKARKLADAGFLNEAAAICETHLREQGVSAEAFYLLGLIRDAAGADSQATEFYRKALYLEPTHYEALIQWASLAKRNGNDAHAQVLQNRAERIKNQS